MPRPDPILPIGRNIAEYAAIVGWWGALLWLHARGVAGVGSLSGIVMAGAIVKAALFGGENIRQLRGAARSDMAHHRFLIVMGVNVSQMILAFALDFHVLQRVNAQSFSGIASDAGQAEMLFDFVYLSTLNFSFFGYSDLVPQTVPARVVNLAEIMLAFVTVIFILSDFISLKESLRRTKE